MSNLQTPYTVTHLAGADVSAQLNRFAAISSAGTAILASSPAATLGQGPFGVFTTVANTVGRAVAVAIRGPVDVIVAATLAPGKLVATNSVGGARPATSGDVVNGQYLGMSNAVVGGLAQIELCPPFRIAGTE